jgi:hypothetical protein
MLDMIVASTPQERKHLRSRDVIDLVRGAALIRLRRANAAFGTSGWQDAICLAGVVSPRRPSP